MKLLECTGNNAANVNAIPEAFYRGNCKMDLFEYGQSTGNNTFNCLYHGN